MRYSNFWQKITKCFCYSIAGAYLKPFYCNMICRQLYWLAIEPMKLNWKLILIDSIVKNINNSRVHVARRIFRLLTPISFPCIQWNLCSQQGGGRLNCVDKATDTTYSNTLQRGIILSEIHLMAFRYLSLNIFFPLSKTAGRPCSVR